MRTIARHLNALTAGFLTSREHPTIREPPCRMIDLCSGFAISIAMRVVCQPWILCTSVVWWVTDAGEAVALVVKHALRSVHCLQQPRRCSLVQAVHCVPLSISSIALQSQCSSTLTDCTVHTHNHTTALFLHALHLQQRTCSLYNYSYLRYKCALQETMS